MCGIIAAFKTENTNNKYVNKLIINQFEEQQSRGTKGFGIIRINNNKKIKIDRACETTKFLLDLYTKKSQMIIAHHRFPTSTNNKLNQTHPIFVSNKILKKNYYVIHNGMISNDEELYKKHTKLGFKYTTEYIEKTIQYNYKIEPQASIKINDSESLAIELALFIENKINKIRIKDKGTFIIIQTNKKNKKAEKIFFGKNKESDLYINQSKNLLQISSEGRGKPVEPNKLFSFKITKKQIKIENKTIKFDKEKIEPVTITQDFPNYQNTKPYRDWIEEESTYQQLIDIPISADYIKKTCEKFKKEIQNSSTNDITHKIDDSLDDQIENIISITDEYKTILLSDRLKKEDIKYYTNQIKKIIISMSYIANIAEKYYTEKELKEEIQQQSKKELQNKQKNRIKIGI